MMIHNCAGKILAQENIAPVDGYVYLVQIFKRRLTRHGTSRNYGNHLYVKIEEYARNEVCLTYDYRNQPTSVGSRRLPTRELVAFTIRHAFFSDIPHPLLHTRP